MPGETLTFDIFANDRASATFKRLGLAADSASGDVKQLGDRLDKLGSRVTTARVGLEGNKEANVELDKLDLKLIKLGKKVANPSIDVEGKAKALADIAVVDLAMDRLDKKFTISGGGGGFLSRLGGLFGGGAGGAAGAAGPVAQGGGGLLAALGPTGAALGGIAAAIGAAALLPALLPTALGGLVGGGAAGGALLLGSSANTQLQALQSSLKGTKGKQRAAILAQIAALRQSSGGELGTFGAFQELSKTGLGVFSGALQARGPAAIGPNGRPIAGSGAPSFLTGLNGILEQIGRFIKSIGPQLGDLFRSSLPFVQAFVKFLEQAAKLLLPAFVQMLQEMTPILPVVVKGLTDIVKGFVGFLNAIGPSGMKASARIFVVLAEGMAAALTGIGHAINWLAENIPTWIRKIHNEFDVLRHETAVIFDGVRHDIAHIWDLIFQDTIGRVIRGAHDIEAEFNTWRHNTAVIFDNVRHDIAHYWDVIWNDTVGRVQRGIGDVVTFFKGLPGKALNALAGFGTDLYNFGHTALTKLWNGLKSVFGDVWSWFKSLPSKLLNAIGIHSPPDWAIEAGQHIMGGLLHGIISRKDELLSRFAAISGGMGSVAGRLTGPAGGVQALAQRIAGIYGWSGQWGDINAVAMRESGWSLTAQNKSSGAYGIAQFINGPSEYYQYGGNPNTAAGQIVAFYNYIKQRYGNPGAAWQHELNYGWYDRGGILPPGLTLAYNATGRPEMVVPGGSGTHLAGQTVIVNVQLGHGTHPVAAAQEIAKVLNVGARNGVRLRTSILGPG